MMKISETILNDPPVPVVLFVYKRLDSLKRVIQTLQKNYLASDTLLYIFSDAAKTTRDEVEVSTVREFIASINGFQKVKVVTAQQNKGLAASVIAGVTDVLKIHKKAIILEDDLETSPNFLDFINAGLTFYENNKSVFSVCGYSFPLEGLDGKDVFFTNRSSSWGWGIWEDRWITVDWEVKDYESFISNTAKKKEFKEGGQDLVRMLKKQMTGKIDSWAIRFTYSQFLQGSISVFPTISKVRNIGFNDLSATHTTGHDPHAKSTVLDFSGKRVFSFPHDAQINPKVLKQFIRPNSNWSKILFKIRTIFN